ncbi:hypothetical protein WJX84_010743, partial [Apatococcus fuscideae]
IAYHKKKHGVIAPKRLIARLRRDNELFRSYMHQDAHEFLNFVLNDMAETLERTEKDRQKRGLPASTFPLPPGSTPLPHKPTGPGSKLGRPPATSQATLHNSLPHLNGESPSSHTSPTAASLGQNGLTRDSASTGAHTSRSHSIEQPNASRPAWSTTAEMSADGQGVRGAPAHAPDRAPSSAQPQQPAAFQTWVQQIFQGRLVSETRCLQCETVTCREEAFFDLSLDIEQNSSITSCLHKFSSTETLNAEDKFFCDACSGLQEAQKRFKIKVLPPILCLHLKRFKYIEQYDRMRKLMYRVVFPFEIKLCNTVEDCPDADALYDLIGVVVHVGSGPNHGHYISYVRSHNKWLLFDDENVEVMDEATVRTAFGSTYEYSSNMDHGYILLYQRQGLL